MCLAQPLEGLWVLNVVSSDAHLQGSLRKTQELLLLLFCALLFGLELSLLDEDGADGRAPQRGQHQRYWIREAYNLRVHTHVRSPSSET